MHTIKRASAILLAFFITAAALIIPAASAETTASISIGTGVQETPTAQVEAVWDSAWFAEPATDYQHSLAMTAMALSGAAYGEKTGMGYRKKKDPSIPDPMPKRQLRRIVKAFKKQGGVIQMDDATDRYLEEKLAEGITLNENTILLRQKPGRASVFEELIHATQFRKGLNDGSAISRLKNEIAAQKKLLKYCDAYKLTPLEIKQTKAALESYTKELEKLLGGI